MATAAHLSSLGFQPMLYTRNSEKLRMLQSHAMESTGILDGSWHIPASRDAKQVLNGASLAIVCTWANAHRAIFETIKHAWQELPPQPLRILVFNGNWGAYEAYQMFSMDYIVPESITIAETAGMPYVAQASFDRIIRCHQRQSILVASSPPLRSHTRPIMTPTMSSIPFYRLCTP